MCKRLASLVASLAVLLPSAALAQSSVGSIRGTVTDQTGAVLAGAKVTIKGEETGFTRSVTTNSAGAYSVSDLPVGRYQAQAEFTGFKTAVRTGVVLNVAESRAVDMELAAGVVTELVSVEATAIAVQTIGGDVSGLVTGRSARELPLNGRNFMQLTLLMPGVGLPDANISLKDKGLLGGSDLSVSGSGVTANLWTIDGANNNDVGSNRTILVYPSLEAIEEFKIHRNSYGAEFGQSAGAQVNIVTRSGTNEFHGGVFYFGRNEALNSRSYFLEQADKPKENLSRHDFGYSLGGPLIKDKLHFFVSQEWNREKRGTVRAAQVPTLLERQGNFSVRDRCSGPVPIDPLTGQPFPGNIIPSDRLNPGGLLYAQVFAEPNTTPSAGTCNNWVTSLDTPIDWRQENIRLDYSMTDSTRLMLRYTQDSWQNGAPNLYTNYWGDDAFPVVDSTWDQPGRSLVLQLNNTIGSTATNSLQFSYSANKITTTRGGTNPGLNNEINAAIPGVFPDSDKFYGADRGHPVFWGALGYGGNLWNQAPFENNQDLFVLKDDYSAVFGNHVFKAGALFSFNKKNENGGGAFDTPAFWGASGLNGWGGATGSNLADLLLKDMAFGFTEIRHNVTAHQRWRDLEFYAADSWKVSPRVTLDAGLRLSNLYAPYYADDKVTNWDPALFNPALGNDPCNGIVQPEGTNPCSAAGFKGGAQGSNRAAYDDATGLLAPRLGVAWDVSGNGKTSIRAGLGRFFLRERLGPDLNLGFNNPPFNQVATGTRYLDARGASCGGCLDPLGLGRPSRAVASDGKTPSNWQWNVTVERELLPNTTLELGYVGNKGVDLLRVHDANQVRAGDKDGNGVSDRLDYVRAGEDNAAQAALRPFGVFGDGTIGFFDHSGSSIYHSLQAQIVSRFVRGSQFQASYTWSRLIADDPLDDSGGGMFNGAISDLDNQGLDRGLVRVHRGHVFNASLVFNLPTLEDRPSFQKHVFGDWQVSTIVYAASGIPLTVYTTSVPGIGGGISGTGYNDNGRPNRVPNEPCRASGGPKEQWLNPKAFTLDGYQLGTFGSAGRGICEGPGIFNVDLAFYKNVHVSEKVTLQLRFEVFNVLNRVNFISVGPAGVNTTFNPQSVTLDAPLGQATRITGTELPTIFGQATATRDPRQAQFGIKLLF